MRGALTRPRRAHLVTLALLLAAAVTVVLAPPAAASGDHADHSTYCGSAEPADFTSLALFDGSAARASAGTTRREPGVGPAEEVPAAAKGKGGTGFTATVPVYFHVVHDGARGNISQSSIDAQMRVLNMTFGGFEGGYNTGFKFALAAVTRTNNPLWFNHGYGDRYEREMKAALHKGGRNVLNIYSTKAAGYLGFAYFPNLSDSRLYLDGIVIHWESIPGTSKTFQGQYDLGKTATHEVGHWINLYHVFQGGCNNWGDYVADTPPQLVATRGCPEGQDSCREPGLDSIHNYMDYSYDGCYNQFTGGQTARMQDAWLHWRVGRA